MQETPPTQDSRKQWYLNEINGLYPRFVQAGRRGDEAECETLRLRINALMNEARGTFHVSVVPVNEESGYFAFRDHG